MILIKLFLVFALAGAGLCFLNSALHLTAALAIGRGIVDDVEREREKQRYKARLVTLVPALLILTGLLTWAV
jgi:hypothetical protein